jgi:integrase/recombinase XerD
MVGSIVDDLVRTFLEAYPVMLGRACPIPPADVRAEIARALERFEAPEVRIRAVMAAALDEAKGAGRLLESFDFLRRFRLREDLELRARVRDALGFEPLAPRKGKDAQPHPMEEEELLREFERFERVEEGRTENTARSHGESIASFRAFLAERRMKIREASRDDVLSWKESLLERGNTERTVNVRLAGVKALYRFLEISELIDRDPSRNVRFLPEQKKRLAILTAAEVDRILDAIDRESPGGLRDYFLIAFIFTTGGRIGEVTGLSLRDVDLGRATVTFRGRKNKEDNVIALTESCVALLRRYVGEVRPVFAAGARPGFEDRLILSMRGRPLDRSNISRIVKRYAKIGKVEKPVSSHTFRRSIATILANNGMPAELLKLFLGHRKLDTTLRNYVVYSEAGQRRALEEFHPLAEGRASGIGGLLARRIGGSRGTRDA